MTSHERKRVVHRRRSRLAERRCDLLDAVGAVEEWEQLRQELRDRVAFERDERLSVFEEQARSVPSKAVPRLQHRAVGHGLAFEQRWFSLSVEEKARRQRAAPSQV